MDDQDVELVRVTIRKLVDSSPPDELVRALYDAGWPDALAAVPQVAVGTLCEAAGVALSAAPVLDAVVLDGLGLDPASTRVALASEAADGAVVGLVPGGWSVPPLRLVVLSCHPASVEVLELAGRELATSPIGGIDPELRLLRVEVPRRSSPADPGDDLGPAVAAAALRGLAHQIVGASSAMLELARSHAVDRTQFGRPIGTFQAVRHHLATALVELEAAGAALDDAWRTGTLHDAMVAKALAGRAAQVVSSRSQQVLGAMGFTWEHPFHRYQRRLLALNVLGGSLAELRAALGARIRTEGTAPRSGGPEAAP